MITEALIQITAVLVAALLKTLDPFNFALPDPMVNPQGLIADMARGTASMGTWVPFSVFAVTVPIALLSWVSGLVFKIGRALISHVPFVGGNG